MRMPDWDEVESVADVEIEFWYGGDWDPEQMHKIIFQLCKQVQHLTRLLEDSGYRAREDE